MSNQWEYRGHDGSVWVIRADSLWQARAAIEKAELRRTDSHAAARLAASTAHPYVSESRVADAFTPPDPFSRDSLTMDSDIITPGAYCEARTRSAVEAGSWAGANDGCGNRAAVVAEDGGWYCRVHADERKRYGVNIQRQRNQRTRVARSV